MQVLYKSTRGNGRRADSIPGNSKRTIRRRGLFVPTSIPRSESSLDELSHMSYQEIAYEVMSRFLTDFTEEELKRVFPKRMMRNLIPGRSPLWFRREMLITWSFSMELPLHLKIWRFDSAASYDDCGKKNHADKEIVILTATSGDTGKAAMAGFADVPGTKIIVFYPRME